MEVKDEIRNRLKKIFNDNVEINLKKIDFNLYCVDIDVCINHKYIKNGFTVVIHETGDMKANVNHIAMKIDTTLINLFRKWDD